MATEHPQVLEPLIDEATLQEWLRCRPSDLRRLRDQRKGPPFVQIGRWRLYRRQDIERWLDREAAASIAEPVDDTATLTSLKT